MALTYQQMCEDIANEFNRFSREKITWENIWNSPSIKRFPAMHIPKLHDATMQGMLDGLLLSDNIIAKIFCMEVLNEKI